MAASSQPGWRRPEVLLLLMAAAVPLSFATWQALINNFAYERAAFTGVGRTGYDNVTGRYWSTWTDTMSTGVVGTSS